MFGPINIILFGAKGDGVTDDTAVIQKAIDVLAERGGGKILFPFTPNGYRIARPAQEQVNGRPCRAQLYIPKGNIMLEGEMPCKLLYDYMVRTGNNPSLPNTYFPLQNENTFLFSDWEAPEEHNPEARPWALLTGLEGKLCNGNFGVTQVSIRNLEFRTRLNPDKMYPTMSAVNLQNVSRVNIKDAQFCLDRNIGDANLGKALQPNPCHTAGLITSGDQDDNNTLRNIAVQGYRYGFVLGENVVATEPLYAHNCEQAMIFHDASHQTVINHVVAQHNQKIINTTENNLFGMPKGPCFVTIGSINFEPGGPDYKPEVSNMTHGVWDPENRLHGSVKYHCGYPAESGDFFPVKGGTYFKAERMNT